jgi:hypothetical protein
LDDVDGNVSVGISGEVDSAVVGTYKLVYSASDSVGNEGNVNRFVEVVSGEATLESLVLSMKQTTLLAKKERPSSKYATVQDVPIKVMGAYSDGHSEEVTDRVKWATTAKIIKIRSDRLRARVGKTKLTAFIGEMKSNTLDIDIQKEEYKLLDREINNRDKKRYPERGASINLMLMKKPTSEVKLKLTLNPSDNVRFRYGSPFSTEVTFAHDYPIHIGENIEIVDKLRDNTEPYTVTTELFESNDSYYDGNKPKDIIVIPSDIRLIAPTIQQRRGAIRGVSITFQVLTKNPSVKYTLIDPPKGMKIIGTSDFGHDFTRMGKDIEWNVPMDAIEGKFYDITVRATDVDGSIKDITFPIKVPTTKPIQTQIINNELIVTDKNSNLYGMKMKGHSGEDISELRLRSVEYEDVWKKRVENRLPEDVVKQTIFILDNMPEALNIKMPEWMDTLEKVKTMRVLFLQYSGSSIYFDIWTGSGEKLVRYENTDGWLYKRKTKSSTNIFGLMPIKSQNKR